MTRADRFVEVCRLVGKSVNIIDTGDGWPGLLSVALENEKPVTVALHVSLVGSHSRAAHELRFQNPGNSKPVSAGGALPILLGYAEYDGKPILVAINGNSRVERHKRFSILFDKRVLVEAAFAGWAVYENSKGDRVYAFFPGLFPVFVQLMLAGLSEDLQTSAVRDLQIAVTAAGVTEDFTEAAPERARRVASSLVRSYAFGRDVVSAYDSLCAMCGMDSGLVVGAHIMPVSAPGSPDKVWNGLALCHNHHVAFDAHKIWVHPKTRSVSFRPDMLDDAKKHRAANIFIRTTYAKLAEPGNKAALPREEMFLNRYNFYDESSYKWSKGLL